MACLASSIVYISPIGFNHGLETPPESPAGATDVVLGHGIPLLVDGGLHSLNIGMADGAGLGLHMHPETEIQGVGIWRVRGSHVLRPEANSPPNSSGSLWQCLPVCRVAAGPRRARCSPTPRCTRPQSA